jgi:hypothetical protein
MVLVLSARHPCAMPELLSLSSSSSGPESAIGATRLPFASNQIVNSTNAFVMFGASFFPAILMPQAGAKPWLVKVGEAIKTPKEEPKRLQALDWEL